MKHWKKLYNSSVSFVCPYCLKIVAFKYASIDHANPTSRFHDNTPKNKILCCKKCNNEKGALTVEEYREWKRLNNIRTGVQR